MIERIFIVIASLILVAIGTYLLHWLFNAKEWAEVYIKKTRPESDRKLKPGSKRYALKQALKQQKVVSKTLDFRNRVIAFLAKDNPRRAPVFIYIIMTSLLIIVIFSLIVLGYLWNQVA